ncbi:MAG: 30S ribosomal protein S6 [Balneolaceae bacterium]
MNKNYYELTYFINPVLDEDKFKEIVDFVNNLIEKNDGEIDEVEEWGLQKFAYDIDGKSNGYYVNLYFEAPPGSIEEIERNLRINDPIMRYLTLKYDAKMMRHRELLKKGEKPTIFEETEELEEEEED